jgi:hypothetical protein
MGLFKKNTPDPISDRSRALTAKISALESKIKKLSEELDPGHNPRSASATLTRSSTASRPPEPGAPHHSEPVFEKVDQNQLKAPAEPSVTPQHFNELGVRKYDLMSLLDRLRKQFQSPPAANTKLVSYLAAGSIQGLRPLRYEKRVARNRFILLATLLILVFLGIFYVLEHRH